ncbi:MAG: hypothetical protein K2P12_04750 [Clostridia bacterium]|nr:hypothetical protein [Clostridia bacterium]
MKKKLVLVVAVMLIVVAACALLVGCAPKNPADFMDKWLDSNAKYMKMAGVEVGINGNISVSKAKIGDNESISYTEISGDNIITYTGVKVGETTTWTKKTMTKAEAKEMLGLKEDIKSINDIIKSQIDFDADDFKDFDKNYTKKDGVYVGNKDTEFEGITIKMTSKEMTITMGEGEEKIEVIYKIGYEKISIPKEAKEAKEM